jgi:hypothetical protein
MQSVTLVIDETPYCVWDWELDRLEGQFLDGIDPSYFAYMAKTHVEHLDAEDAQCAALALRMTYSHAQETLMSLLCATVQAPDCVIGWLHKYRNEELERVVRKLDRHQPVLTKLNLLDLSWEGLSSLVHRYVSLPDKEKEERIKRNFGAFWARIATEFLDEAGRREYNSIKHGLRARSGGFQLMAGLETTPGIPCPPDQMKSLGGSQFGTTFYSPEPVEGVEKCNIKIVNSSRNWLPEQLAARIHVMSTSMENVISFLKVASGGDPKEHRFSWPADLGLFDACWQYSTGMTSASFETVLTAQDIQPLSKQTILDRYDTGGGNAGPSQSS